MTGETLYTATKYFRPFPEPEVVFAGDVARHAEFLLPLASVDLSHLSRDWSGWLHFVTPIEPEEGMVGSEAGPYYNYLCRENWVGYHIRDGKYEFATDFRYFQKSRQDEQQPAAEGAPDKARLSLAVHYEDMKGGYNVQKANFHERGCLHHAWAKRGFFGYKNSDRVQLVKDLGGVSREANWSNLDNFPLSSPGNWVDEEGTDWRLVCPLTEDGRLFTYIGMVSVNEYVRPNPDFRGMDADLHLFYDPVGRIALTTFDFS